MCGNTHITKSPAWVTDNALICAFDSSKIHIDYLRIVIDSLELRQKSNSTAQPVITGKIIYPSLIPLPPYSEQYRIIQGIEHILGVLLLIKDSRSRYKRILSETPTSLRQQLIQAAIQGQLVPQNPSDEPASVLLERIAQERTAKLGKKAAKSVSRIKRRGSKTHPTYHEVFSDGSEKEISEEIPFSIPANWQWTRLGTIADVKGGKRIPSGMHTTSDKTAHVYIRVADMIKGSISDNNLVYISDDVFKKISRYTISKDDLYLTIAGTIGKAGIVPDFFDGMNLTENAVKITNFSLNKQFLLFLLISECCKSQFTAKTTCVAQPKLAIERIVTTLLPIPPLKEQEKVCKTLQKCLELVDRT